MHLMQFVTYHGLTLSKGIGSDVKNTVNNRNDFLPQTSDSAPINGADKKDKNPYTQTNKQKYE